MLIKQDLFFYRMKLVNKIVRGVFAVGIIAGISYLSIRVIKEIDTFNRVNYILDINRDGELSSEEIKRFYDETGTTPYTKQFLKKVSKGDLKKFLDKYK